ncbi:TetR/AcrR family transcriptional regulator [Sphingomonas abietis]|uniref:TetR family transcriptional regulator n=1 Tax=Sphingomonas abietis TaxID=3012344 RepID=A0ABY7NHR2_9SPHN|nr:TetR family transcriptional regulator [Sphingomonas abietis]WBO21053.1 TetR family transcriptional regulator [Sphingomonas abietis]
MVRRIENARERFGRAAMELFRTQGYSQTTIPQIATAAGLTERTFFRYFVDKPEVLFWRAGELEADIVAAIDKAEGDRPLDLATAALAVAGRFFDENRADVLVRQAVIAAHVDFQERELAKMHALTLAIHAVLVARGISQAAARIAAETSIVIWRVAIDRWSRDCSTQDFAGHVHACQAELYAVVLGES